MWQAKGTHVLAEKDGYHVPFTFMKEALQEMEIETKAYMAKWMDLSYHHADYPWHPDHDDYVT
jgi:cystathionine beta-lyase/cystathionine gamma-synthase